MAGNPTNAIKFFMPFQNVTLGTNAAYGAVSASSTKITVDCLSNLRTVADYFQITTNKATTSTGTFTLFTLPTGLRPAKTIVVPIQWAMFNESELTYYSGAPTRAFIRPDGKVNISAVTPNASYTYLRFYFPQISILSSVY